MAPWLRAGTKVGNIWVAGASLGCLSAMIRYTGVGAKAVRSWQSMVLHPDLSRLSTHVSHGSRPLCLGRNRLYNGSLI